jgi:hypothetical protein
MFTTMYFKRDELKLNDDLFGFFDVQRTDHFYQMSHTKIWTSPDDSGAGKGVYFRQDIKLDKEYDIYER